MAKTWKDCRNTLDQLIAGRLANLTIWEKEAISAALVHIDELERLLLAANHHVGSENWGNRGPGADHALAGQIATALKT